MYCCSRLDIIAVNSTGGCEQLCNPADIVYFCCELSFRLDIIDSERPAIVYLHHADRYMWSAVGCESSWRHTNETWS